MALSKVLYTCLGGAISVIILLIGSWMTGQNASGQIQDHRIATLESHYAVMDERLLDIQHRLQELKEQIDGK